MSVVLMALAMAGCTGGDDKESKPDAKPSASPSQAEPGPSLCDVLDADDLQRFSGDYTARPDLMLGHEVFLGCDTDGMSSFEFGVKVVDDGRELTDYLQTEPQKIADLGDEAYRATPDPVAPDLGDEVVARKGDRIVFVRNRLISYGKERSTEQDTVDVAKRLLSDDSTELIDSIEKIEVSAPCPSVDEVAKVVGTVQAARGHTVGDAVDCHYVGADGIRFIADRFGDDNPAQFLGSSGEATELEGTESARVSDDGNVIELKAITSDEVLSFRAGALDLRSETSVERKAFDALVADTTKALLG
ncbi:hypothetical protein [Aeromicrobium flavum]|uniref:hypothetical protein n=1 Tax=Aeromicrobium flavum TaxID=416568 RepID=UPI0011BEBC5D|nr:hypothetical protein [Aeromicrobium flavum]